MSIQDNDLKRNFMILDPHLLVKEALDQVGEEQDLYLVIGFGEGKYACVHWSEITKSLNSVVRLQERTKMLNTRLGDLLELFTSPAVDQFATELWQAEQARKRIASQCLVVTAAGQVVGVLAPPRREPVVFRSGRSVGGTSVGAAPPTPGMGVLGGDNGEEAEKAKKINIQLMDQELNRVKPEEKPLQLNQAYTLVVDIADQSRPGSIVSDAFLRYRWKTEEQEVKLTVRLESDDFEILSEPQRISVPRSGDSTKARFDLKPTREGRGVVSVLFFKEDVFIQLLTLKFTVVDGALFSQETAGKSLEAAFVAQPRDLNLVILKGDDGFQLVMTGAVAATARLPITPQFLAFRIAELRKILQEQIVFMKDPQTNNQVHLYNIDIPASARDLALRRLADAGYGLYRDIFYGMDADSQTNLIGDKLREMARGEETLKIQIFSQHFTLPWGLLYMAGEEEYDLENIHPDWFLGLKHIVEQIPLQQMMQVTDSKIDSRSGLTVSINVNSDIDRQMGAPLVASQLEYWKGIEASGEARLVQRTKAEELLEALKDTQTTTDQIFYFYCHAASKDLEEGGPDASTLVFSGNEKLTLKDLKRLTPMKRFLPGEPLIYINACESAELSPLFYDGFVPYFLAKGARGVIGTECETPALFAVEWAKRFFNRFLAGDPLGKVFLDLRQEFFYKHNNILGILYSLYIDGDTQVAPGLKNLVETPKPEG